MSKTKREDIVDESSVAMADADSKKRKRSSIAPSEDELEIDVNLPEPPSKKAKRDQLKKEKRLKKRAEREAEKGETSQASESAPKLETAGTSAPKRSDNGIWIGNLPWSATKESLCKFLKEQGSIEENDIVRVHMPPPQLNKGDQRAIKPQNKGFAYVDFSTKAVLDAALELTEQLLGGRKVLIKNAKSYEGRPEKPKTENPQAAAGGTKANAKPPARRIFVGNLDFAVTEDDLREHFSQAGEVEDVHIATFQDSGKCKGYGWVRFGDLEAAGAAVRGFIFKHQGEEAEGGGDEEASDTAEEKVPKKKQKSSKGKKRQKWFINRLNGRELRCEFAEDSAVRYKKRFGKEAQQQQQATNADDGTENTDNVAQQGAPARHQSRGRSGKHVDARNVAPAKALANAPRGSAAIVAGVGKKLTFDE